MNYYIGFIYPPIEDKFSEKIPAVVATFNPESSGKKERFYTYAECKEYIKNWTIKQYPEGGCLFEIREVKSI